LNFDKILDLAHDAVQWVSDKLEQTVEAVGKVADQMVSAVKAVAGSIVSAVTAVAHAVNEVLNSVADFFGGVFQDIFGGLFGGSWESVPIPSHYTYDVSNYGDHIEVHWNERLAQQYLGDPSAHVELQMWAGRLVLVAPSFKSYERVAHKDGGWFGSDEDR